MDPVLSWDVSTQQQSQNLPPGKVLAICFSLLLGKKSVVFLLFCFLVFFCHFKKMCSVAGWLTWNVLLSTEGKALSDRPEGWEFFFMVSKNDWEWFCLLLRLVNKRPKPKCTESGNRNGSELSFQYENDFLWFLFVSVQFSVSLLITVKSGLL